MDVVDCFLLLSDCVLRLFLIYGTCAASRILSLSVETRDASGILLILLN